jgi:hypothetical protein
MATWSDIERAMNQLEDLDKPTLEAFARIMPEASGNPTYRHRFDLAQQRIRRRLDQIEAQEIRSAQKSGEQRNDDHWYKKPISIVTLSVAAGVLLLLIKLLFGL